MSAIEDRLTALESDMQAAKRQLARMAKPRPWLDEVAGSMDDWPEFEEVLRLGSEIRRSVSDGSNHGASGG